MTLSVLLDVCSDPVALATPLERHMRGSGPYALCSAMQNVSTCTTFATVFLTTESLAIGSLARRLPANVPTSSLLACTPGEGGRGRRRLAVER